MNLITLVAASAAAILCVGDSITASHPTLISYPDLSSHETINIGISGTTTGFWLFGYAARVRPVLEEEKIRSVHILLGVNDSAWLIPPERYRENLTDLVELLYADGVRDVVLSVPTLRHGEGLVIMRSNQLQYQYEIQIHTVVAAFDHVRLGVDFAHGTELEEADFFDGVHPGAPGQEKMTLAFDSFYQEKKCPKKKKRKKKKRWFWFK